MYDFKTAEEEILKFWEENRIYEKSRKKNAKGKNFYFLQGPPYTSGRLHIGHAWNNSMKDIALRFFRMRGRNVWDRAGYDMHGLPTENKVQQKLNLKDKDEIIKFGVGKFSKECLKFSTENAKIMNRDLKRLGIWMDFENAYLPVENDFMSSEWLLIKKAYEQKRLYKGKKIMHWCGKCETSLAKHELEYETIKDKSIYVSFKLKNKDGCLVIWTTTPWTIPFNLAVMVNPDLEYVELAAKGEVYYIAKELAKKFAKDILEDENATILKTVKGKDMEGWEYLHPFGDAIDYSLLKKESPKVHTILLSKEYVNLESGTGLVHNAPGCGPEDFEVAQEYKIKPFNTLNEKGELGDVGEFSGLIAKKDDWKFIKALDDRRALLGEEFISHEYAHCWRCHTPVIFRATEQWFWKVEDLIPKILDYNKKIKWVPKTVQNSYESWISNLKDNGITRQRFWGTPAPIWECKCGNVEVIGSQEELKKRAIGKLPENLHKPWIDSVKIKCPKCNEEISRIPDVLDVWIDSGTASWNCLYYPKKENLLKEFFPADLIVEASEQARLWFSMLQVCSTILFGKSCYKGVFGHGMILDFQGMKMSKSIGNMISPYEVIDKYSSEILRYYICETNAGENINFNWEDVKQKQRNLLVLTNTANYLVQLKDLKGRGTAGIEEKYILSKLNHSIETITKLFENYEFDKTITECENLFLDISRIYIKMTRDKSAEFPEVVFKALKEAYVKSLQMFAPICPLLTEHLWQQLRKEKIVEEESVHLSSWPKVENKNIDEKLEQEMEKVLRIIEAGLAGRDKAQIGLKWPLASAEITLDKKIRKELEGIIGTQLNVKKIKFISGEEIKVEFDTVMTPELEAEGYAREVARQIQAFRKELGLQKQDQIKLWIIVDADFKNILDKNENFIETRTNSEEINIVTTAKETFKNRTDFKVKNKEGAIGIIAE